MKAFVVETYGKDGLSAAEVPEPELGEGDVLVKVSAASVNPLDKMVRNGEFKRLLKYRTPFVLGHDVAGVVTRVGSAVGDFQVGDEVYARPRDLRIGTFAEYIAINHDDLAPKPESLTLHQAAAVPLVSLAAWQALVDRAHLKPGQKVLVHAGSGGLGSTVIQLAKHLGATVATTASGQNAELVRSLGADVVADYKKENFAEVLSGYDVVLDSLGGENRISCGAGGTVRCIEGDIAIPIATQCSYQRANPTLPYTVIARRGVAGVYVRITAAKHDRMSTHTERGPLRQGSSQVRSGAARHH